MEIDEKNITFTAAAAVNKICKPLFENLHIKDFAYSRIYPDGSRSILNAMNAADDSRLIKLFKQLLPHFHKSDPSYISGVDLLPLTKMIVFESDLTNFMPEGLPCTIDASMRRIDLQNNLDIVDRLFITHKMRDYCENFIFCFSNNVPYKTLIINQLSLVEKFTNYFKTEATKLIEAVKHEKIIPAWRDKQYFTQHKNQLPLPETSVSMPWSQENIHFTKTELICISYLLEGKTLREIGELRCRSLRTIENHFDQIKLKLGVRSRSEAIAKLIKCGYSPGMIF